MRPRPRLACLALAAGVLVACAGPATAPDPTATRGRVESLTLARAPDGADRPSIIVRALDGGDRDGLFVCSGAAQFTVGPDARVLDANGRIGDAGVLRVGQVVTVWRDLDYPVLESCTPIAVAARVRVERP